MNALLAILAKKMKSHLNIKLKFRRKIKKKLINKIQNILQVTPNIDNNKEKSIKTKNIDEKSNYTEENEQSVIKI
jgi:hypothetical protein